MGNEFNRNHLLWWIMKAIHCCRADGTRPDTLISETMWKNIGAPDWVLPAIKEKYSQFNPSTNSNHSTHNSSVSSHT